MPTYPYECARCGAFEAAGSVASFDRPAACPSCGGEAPRMLTVPQFALGDGGRRRAEAVNERSASEPRRSHGSGCGCCGPRRVSAPGAAKTSDAMKTSGSRPWMISH